MDATTTTPSAAPADAGGDRRPPRAGRTGLLQAEPSLLDRAKRGDRSAIDKMFGQFLPPGEIVRDSDYLGVLGMWGFGTHSFAAVTDRRVATLRVGLLGAVTYQDGGLEHVNSGVVVQPSRWLLYVAATAWLLLAGVLSLGLSVAVASGAALTTVSLLMVASGAVLLLPILVNLHYRFRKCGMVLYVREGSNVYAFADRKLLRRANALYRTAQALRERRLLVVGGGDGGRVDLPAQRPSDDATPGGPRRRTRGIAVVAAGALLVVAGLALPVATAGDEGAVGSLAGTTEGAVESGATTTDSGTTDSGTTETEAPAAEEPVPQAEPFAYGDDPVLDELWDGCEAADGAACDQLYTESPSGSEYEEFGWTCGGRLPAGTECALYDLE